MDDAQVERADRKEKAKWLVLAFLAVVLVAIIIARFSGTLAATWADNDPVYKNQRHLSTLKSTCWVLEEC